MHRISTVMPQCETALRGSVCLEERPSRSGRCCIAWVCEYASSRQRAGYFQRVVIRKPAIMNPKPMPRFQRPRAGMGNFSEVM